MNLKEWNEVLDEVEEIEDSGIDTNGASHEIRGSAWQKNQHGYRARILYILHWCREKAKREKSDEK